MRLGVQDIGIHMRKLNVLFCILFTTVLYIDVYQSRTDKENEIIVVTLSNGTTSSIELPRKELPDSPRLMKWFKEVTKDVSK